MKSILFLGVMILFSQNIFAVNYLADDVSVENNKVTVNESKIKYKKIENKTHTYKSDKWETIIQFKEDKKVDYIFNRLLKADSKLFLGSIRSEEGYGSCRPHSTKLGAKNIISNYCNVYSKGKCAKIMKMASELSAETINSCGDIFKLISEESVGKDLVAERNIKANLEKLTFSPQKPHYLNFSEMKKTSLNEIMDDCSEYMKSLGESKITYGLKPDFPENELGFPLPSFYDSIDTNSIIINPRGGSPAIRF